MSRRAFYEKFYPLLQNPPPAQTKSTSEFQSRGKLTPQEFLEAGDLLCQKMPAWQWVAGDVNFQRYLPADKKFLILKDVPCRSRCSGDSILITTDEDRIAQQQKTETKMTEIAKEDSWNWDDDDDEDDDDGVSPKPEDLVFRTYDLSVVYDQYYACPRLYLVGYQQATSRPLTKDEMMEDIYRTGEGRCEIKRAVTFDPCPYHCAPCISIHPRCHSDTVKSLIQNLQERFETYQKESGVEEAERANFFFPTDRALFLFLEMLSSMIPTIEYDTLGILSVQDKLAIVDNIPTTLMNHDLKGHLVKFVLTHGDFLAAQARK